MPEAQLPGLDGLSVEVLLPGQPGYDDVRAVENALFDKRPAAIVLCTSDEDVVEAVDFAREQGLEIAIKGGGHHMAGLALTDGGLMLDMSGLNAIDVDAGARTVRAGAGLRWRDLIGATQVHGLATASGTASAVGIVGLTLGGGLGWLMAKHGLAADNLLAARVVTADGQIVTASAEQHPDLFWALRGGGGNFGVVTELTYRLHPVGPMVTAGFVAHPIDAAPDVLRFYRDFTTRGLSDDVVVLTAMLHGPDGTGIVAFGLLHLGSDEQAQRELEPLLTYGSPLMVDVGPTPYTAWLERGNDLTPEKPVPNYLKSSFLRELPDDAIDVLTRSFAACPSPMSVLVLDHFHGAVARVPIDATPVAYRKVGYNFMAFAAWADPATSDENIAWIRHTYEAMRPFFDDRVFANYVGSDDIAEDDTARRVYGPNLEQLIDVKTAYDPQNLFHVNLNILPRSAAEPGLAIG